MQAGYDQAHLQVTTVETERLAADQLLIRVEGSLKTPDDGDLAAVEQRYLVKGDGTIQLKTRFNPIEENLPVLPRLGYEMQLKPSFSKMAWYGRGPHENYIDRNAAALLGIYEGSVREQFVNYPVPQENGNKTGIRWVQLTDEQGRGVQVTSTRPFETSARHYSLDNLSKAAHTYELEEKDQVFWYVDFQQNGLGGNSCGPRPMEQYLFKPEAVEFEFTIGPLSSNYSKD